MSQFLCHCGFVIRDNQPPHALSAWLFRDELYGNALAKIGAILEEFHECKSKEDWIARELGDDYPKDAPFSMLADDIMTRELLDIAMNLFQCPSCQRLYPQCGIQKNEYDSFLPEPNPFKPYP